MPKCISVWHPREISNLKDSQHGQKEPTLIYVQSSDWLFFFFPFPDAIQTTLRQVILILWGLGGNCLSLKSIFFLLSRTFMLYFFFLLPFFTMKFKSLRFFLQSRQSDDGQQYRHLLYWSLNDLHHFFRAKSLKQNKLLVWSMWPSCCLDLCNKVHNWLPLGSCSQSSTALSSRCHLSEE